MSIPLGIHDQVLEYVRDALISALITGVPDGDPTKAGAVKIGHLQGEPGPDEARISVTVHENDPDKFVSGSLTSIDGSWDDEPLEIEVGGSLTTDRKFTIKGRCLFEGTRENLDTARAITSAVRDRVERTILRLSFAGIATVDEFVARGAASTDIQSETLQAGGPPDAYDYHFKIRFSILTTRNGVTQ